MTMKNEWIGELDEPEVLEDEPTTCAICKTLFVAGDHYNDIGDHQYAHTICAISHYIRVMHDTMQTKR